VPMLKRCPPPLDRPRARTRRRRRPRRRSRGCWSRRRRPSSASRTAGLERRSPPRPLRRGGLGAGRRRSRRDVRAVQAVEVAEGVQVDLTGDLAAAYGNAGSVSIDSLVGICAACRRSIRPRRWHDLAGLRLARGFGEPDRADDVGLGVELWVRNGLADVDLSGEMEDDFGLVCRQRLSRSAVTMSSQPT